MSVIGLVAGFLVGITSVGSGSIVMMMLLLFYSFQPKVMVGTDIVHALILTGVTSLLHFRMHNVDTHLVGALLLGSVPGGIARFLLEHAGSGSVAATYSLRGVAGDGRPYAHGLKRSQCQFSVLSAFERSWAN